MFALNKSALAGLASTSLFVLLWSSGAIASKWGLAHSSPFAFLVFRFGIALACLLPLAPLLRLRAPRSARERGKALLTGLVMLGVYPIFYIFSLKLQVTPGMMATILGVQPILTAVILERRQSPARLFGLLLGLAGLVLVVYQGIGLAGMSTAGILCALLALAGVTGGSIMQKGIRENPLGTLPLQYLAGLGLCLAFVPFQPFEFEWNAGFLVPALWMGVVVSVGATLLLYRLIAQGNLVNATSLFYLVPAVTAIMDFMVFGNRLGWLSLLGMGLIVVGLMFVFRKAGCANRAGRGPPMAERARIQFCASLPAIAANPGPGTAVTSRDPTGSPHSGQTMVGRNLWPQALCTYSTGAPRPSSSQRSPQLARASSTGCRSWPISVRRYS